jgi:hypothetical protein
MTQNHLKIGLILVLLSAGSTLVKADDEKRLSLDEARQAMLELINKDRAQYQLTPVALDEIASRAAQGHAEEMARNVYLSHVNLAGEKPDVRYTKAGGVDSVGENTYIWTGWSTPQPPVSLPLQAPEQTFSKTDLEAIEYSYISEKPPLDGHRRQILDPHHTHVGIGLGRATDGKAICLTNTQEFVDRYFELDPISQTASGGEKVVLSGKAPQSKPLYAVAVGREDLPAPITREQTSQLGGYSRPDAEVWRFAGHDFKTQKDGRFQAAFEIPKNRPGVYYIMIWARDDPAKTRTEGLFIASCRTVVVK